MARARKLSFVFIIQLALLRWDAQEGNWARWDERWQDARRILDTPAGDPEIARVATAAAAAAFAAGDPTRAEDVLAIARHVGR